MNKFLLILLLCLSRAFAQDLTASEIEGLLQKAEQGDVRAQTTIGFLYYEAKGIPQNPEKAIHWSKLAAQAGHGPAQINLGYFYSIGFGVPKDVNQTVYWYEAAVKQGMPLANYNLGSMYVHGTDVEKNLEKAAGYFKKSAAKNHTPSLIALGGMYVNGEGVKKDGYEAARYFKKAAELGDIQSHLELGKMYSYGLGVPKDVNEARSWYSRAAERGSKDAKIALQELPALESKFRAEDRKRNQDYIQNLKRKYSSRLKYEGSYALGAIQNFKLDCRASDGRYLPLENVLLAKLASMDEKHAWLVIRADSRGDDVRIYDDLVGADGRVMNSTVSFELNKWGEIRSKGARMEAVLNSCFGSYGPIWVVPNR